MSQSERCVPAPLTCPELCSMSSTFLSTQQCNGRKAWWKTVRPLAHILLWLSPHTLLPSLTCRITPRQNTSCSQSLYPSDLISIFQKRSVWCIHLTLKFSAWMVRLKLYQKTGSSEVSDNLDRQCYWHCTRCRLTEELPHWVRQRVFSASWMKLSSSNF